MTKFSDLTLYDLAVGGGTLAAVIGGWVAYANHDRRPRLPASHLDCTYIERHDVMNLFTDTTVQQYLRDMKRTRSDGKVCAGITVIIPNGERWVVLKDE